MSFRIENQTKAKQNRARTIYALQDAINRVQNPNVSWLQGAIGGGGGGGGGVGGTPTDYEDLGTLDGTSSLEIALNGKAYYLRKVTLANSNALTFGITSENLPENELVELCIYFVQDATGGRTINPPSAVKFPGGDLLNGILGKDPNEVSKFRFTTYDAGMTWFIEKLSLEGAAPVGAPSLADLTDTSITSSLADNHLLVYDASNTDESKHIWKTKLATEVGNQYGNTDVLTYLGTLGKSIWDGIVNLVSSVVGQITTWLEDDMGILGWLYDFFTKTNTDGITAFGNDVRDAFKSTLTWLTHAWDATVGRILPWFYTTNSSGSVLYFQRAYADEDPSTTDISNAVTVPTVSKHTPNFSWTNFFSNFWNRLTDFFDRINTWWLTTDHTMVSAIRNLFSLTNDNREVIYFDPDDIDDDFTFFGSNDIPTVNEGSTTKDTGDIPALNIRFLPDNLWKWFTHYASEITDGFWGVLNTVFNAGKYVIESIIDLFSKKNSNGDTLYYTETQAQSSNPSGGVTTSTSTKMWPNYNLLNPITNFFSFAVTNISETWDSFRAFLFSWWDSIGKSGFNFAASSTDKIGMAFGSAWTSIKSVFNTGGYVIDELVKQFYKRDSSGNILYYTQTEAQKSNPTGGVIGSQLDDSRTTSNPKAYPNFNWLNPITNFLTAAATDIRTVWDGFTSLLASWWNNIGATRTPADGTAGGTSSHTYSFGNDAFGIIWNAINTIGEAVWPTIAGIGSGIWSFLQYAVDTFAKVVYLTSSNGNILYFTAAEAAKASPDPAMGRTTPVVTTDPTTTYNTPVFSWQSFFDSAILALDGAVDATWTTLQEHFNAFVGLFTGGGDDSGGATTLADLTDTDIDEGDDLVRNQFLVWRGSDWKNRTIGLNGLSDVFSTDNPAENDVLYYSGTGWVNGTVAGGANTGLSNLGDVVMINKPLNFKLGTDTGGSVNTNSIGYASDNDLYLKMRDTDNSVYMQFGGGVGDGGTAAADDQLQFDRNSIIFHHDGNVTDPTVNGEIRVFDDGVGEKTIKTMVKGVVKDFANMDRPIPFTRLTSTQLLNSAHPINIKRETLASTLTTNKLEFLFGSWLGAHGVVRPHSLTNVDGSSILRPVLWIKSPNKWFGFQFDGKISVERNLRTGIRDDRLDYGEFEINVSTSTSNEPLASEIHRVNGAIGLHYESDDADDATFWVYDGAVRVKDEDYDVNVGFPTFVGDELNIFPIPTTSTTSNQFLNQSSFFDNLAGEDDGYVAYAISVRRFYVKIEGEWWYMNMTD